MTATKSPLKVTYRAAFKSPLKGPLNQMGINFPVAMEIEVYAGKDGKNQIWKARSIGNGNKKDCAIASTLSPEAMKAQVAGMFQSQESGWRIYADLVNKIDGD